MTLVPKLAVIMAARRIGTAMLLLQAASLPTVHGGDSTGDVRVGESGLYCGGGGQGCVVRNGGQAEPTCLYFVERAACDYAVANLNAAALNGVGEEGCQNVVGCPRFACSPLTVSSSYSGNHSIMILHPRPYAVQQCTVAANLLARAARISTADVGCSVGDGGCSSCTAWVPLPPPFQTGNPPPFRRAARPPGVHPHGPNVGVPPPAAKTTRPSLTHLLAPWLAPVSPPPLPPPHLPHSVAINVTDCGAAAAAVAAVAFPPTAAPTTSPTRRPTPRPTRRPTLPPTPRPTRRPTVAAPSTPPTAQPTSKPPSFPLPSSQPAS